MGIPVEKTEIASENVRMNTFRKQLLSHGRCPPGDRRRDTMYPRVDLMPPRNQQKTTRWLSDLWFSARLPCGRQTEFTKKARRNANNHSSVEPC